MPVVGSFAAGLRVKFCLYVPVLRLGCFTIHEVHGKFSATNEEDLASSRFCDALWLYRTLLASGRAVFDVQE